MKSQKNKIITLWVLVFAGLFSLVGYTLSINSSLVNSSSINTTPITQNNITINQTQALKDATLETDKNSYLLNETVKIMVLVPDNILVNLKVKPPKDNFSNLLENHWGNLTYLYSTTLPGNYTAIANVSFLGEERTLTANFALLPLENVTELENVTSPLANVTLQTDRKTYLLNETVEITLNAPENATGNLWILNPEKESFHAVENSGGSFSFLYSTTLPGNYTAVANISWLEEKRTLITNFTLLALENVTTQILVKNVSQLLANATLGTGKESYLVNETIRITLNASESTIGNLWILNPENESFHAVENTIGSFTFLYASTLPGDYTVIAEISLLGENRTLTGIFEVLALENVTGRLVENFTQILANATLEIDKKTYLVNETIRITLNASESTIGNLWILNPENESFHAIENSTGSFTFLYSTTLLGNYKARAELSLFNETTTLEAHFGILDARLKPKKIHFKAYEEPEFELDLVIVSTEKKVEETEEKKQTKKWVSEGETLETFVYYNEKLIDLEPRVEKVKEGKFSIKLPKKRAFRAGLYKLKVILIEDNETYIIQEKSFTWGVLAINTHKSIYLENEPAFIGIAVLDDEGHMVCDADATLEITNPIDEKTILSTSNGKILISDACSYYGVTNLPDYYANYTVNGIGIYSMNLTAVTPNGVRSITDSFFVQKSVDYDVARYGPTRIYPLALYVMNLTIKANKNYEGMIKEKVPASFVITPQEGMIVEKNGDIKTLYWNLSLEESDTLTLAYEFDAPDVSPEFYLLGPLEIGEFQEKRKWQIASDAPTIGYYYAPDNSIGGDWAQTADADQAPDGASDDDQTDNDNDLFTYGFTGLPTSGTINNVSLMLTWYESDTAGDDEVELKYRIGALGAWRNLDGTVYSPQSGTSIASPTPGSMTNQSYEITATLTWDNLSEIYLGIEGDKVTGPDNDVAYIDAIWLRINHTPLVAVIVWNQSNLSLGSGVQNAGDLTGYARINSTSANNNVIVTCSSGNCTNITENWSDGTNMVNGDSFMIQFNCSDDSFGSYWALFNVTSTEDSTPNQINVSCEITNLGPTVSNVNVTPQKVLNGTAVNITANVTDDYGVSLVKALLYYPNGTNYQNLTMSNGGSGDIYWNDTYTVEFYPHGSYTVTIWANDTSGNTNDSESSWFAPYLNLSDDQAITINGTFEDWVGVKNVTDIIGDACTGAVTTLQYKRPVNWTTNGTVIAPENATDRDYNDTISYASIHHVGGSCVNYTYDLPDGETNDVSIHIRIFGYTIKTGLIKIYNFSSGSFYNWFNTTTNIYYQRGTTLTSDLINSSGGVILQVCAKSAGVGNQRLYDTHITLPGNTYDFKGITTGSTTHNATENNNACTGEWCTGGTEITTAEYQAINMSDDIYHTATVEQNYYEYNFKINESEDSITSLTLWRESYHSDNPGPAPIWTYWNDSSSSWVTWNPGSPSSDDDVPIYLEFNDTTAIKNIITDLGYIHLRIYVGFEGDDEYVDYVKVDITSSGGGGNDFDLRTVSLANNNAHLFAMIDVNGTVDYSDPTAEYYRLFISVNESAGNESTPDAEVALPFKYNYMVESYNESIWRIYNVSDVNIANATAANDSDTIEVAILLSDINVTIGNEINVSFETSSSSERYDLAPDNASFLSYTVALVAVEWNQSNLSLGSVVQNGGNLIGYARINSTSANNNVIVTCSSGNCTNITDNWSDGTNMVNGDSFLIQFNCSDDSAGSYWALFNVTSNEDTPPDQINVSCQILSLYDVTDCKDITSPGTYTLQNDIINSTTSYCINISANNVVFDCQGYKVDGNDTAEDYGIYVWRSSPTSTNITIKNCNVSDWDTAGVYFYKANNNTLENLNVSSNLDHGIYLDSSLNNTLTNITANSNSLYGIHLDTSPSNTFTNIIASSNQVGIYLSSSSSNTFTNITANSNTWGIYLYSSSSNTLSNITANSNSDDGIYIDDDHNRLINLTIYSNYYGIELDTTADNNTIANCTIYGNTQAGIWMKGAGPNTPNLIYNNLFNNTRNYNFSETVYANDWNTTQQTGTRIIYSAQFSQIGGNFWTNPTATGFSDNCTDSEPDGFCDTEYNLSDNDAAVDNIDWLPLAKDRPPVVLNVTIIPQKVLNGTAVNITANVTDGVGVSAVKALLYYPNGTNYQNLTMSNGGSGDIYWNDTYTVEFYPSGTYNVTIWANDTSGNTNDSESSWFAPYLSLSDGQAITINGSFEDWVGVKNVTDIIGDAGSGAVTTLQYKRPVNWLVYVASYKNPENATDRDYNDTSTRGMMDAGTGTCIGNYTYDLPDGATSATLYVTWEGTVGGGGAPTTLAIWNFTAGGWWTWKSYTASFNQELISINITNTSGLINDSGGVIIQFMANYHIAGGNNVYIYDTHITLAGNTYDFKDTTDKEAWLTETVAGETANPPSSGEGVKPNSLIINREFTAAEYSNINASDTLNVEGDGSSWTQGTYHLQWFNFTIDESASSIAEISIRWEGRSDIGGGTAGTTLYLYIWNGTGWEGMGTSPGDIEYIEIYDFTSDIENYLDANNNLYLIVEGSVAQADGPCMPVTDYVKVDITSTSGGGNNFDLRTVSLANNDSHLFAMIDVNGTVDYSSSGSYYRLFISVNESAGNESTPDAEVALPFKYNYMVESYNESIWRIYNVSDVNIVNATAANDSDTIEVAIPLSDINVTIGNEINVSFETSSSSERYDLAPDNASFLSYTVVAGVNIAWNQSELSLGSGAQNAGYLNGSARIIATSANNNVIVTCSSGNCTNITENWSDGTNMVDGDSFLIQFNCSDDTVGSYWALFNVTSDEDATPDQINVSCTIISPYDVTDCKDITSPGTYYLQNDIINSTTSYCINISANNVTFDCQGHTIDGNDTVDYGIWIYRAAETVTNITIKDCAVTDWDKCGILFYKAHNNTLENLNVSSNPRDGIYLQYSDSNTFTNITANSNTRYGIYLESSSNSNTFTNITANSNNYGIYLYSSSNTFTNIIANSNNYGISLDSSSNNTLTNITANSNTQYGIYLYSSSNNTLTNITANLNTHDGIHFLFSSNSNTLTNITANSNTQYGIHLYSSSNNNTIANSRIENSSSSYAGICINSSANNTLYNNFFNNTVNYKFVGTIYANNWNTTQQTGTRVIYSGSFSEIGGNFWTNPTATGFSDNCTDSEPDGFCDTEYNLSDGSPSVDNIDWLPLAKPVAVAVSWNQSNLSLGSGQVNAGYLNGSARIDATSAHNNVVVTCSEGNCTNITDNWSDGTNMNGGDSFLIEFNCSDDSAGSYWALFNVTSTEDATPNQINVSCEITSANQAPTLINAAANATSLDVGDSINFTIFWNDSGDDVQLLIANQSDFANCNTSNQSWCLCNTSFITGGDAGNYSNCSYTAQSGDGGKTINWYAQVCDDGSLCDSLGTITDTFTDETKIASRDNLTVDTAAGQVKLNGTGGWCYQEHANVSTACGGLSTGVYKFTGSLDNETAVIDGYWDTYSGLGEGTAYINYSKPSDATNNSLWQVKDTVGGTVNLTLTANCWNQNPLQLKMNSTTYIKQEAYYDCWNGTNWINLRKISEGNHAYLHEEAMWWNVITYNYSGELRSINLLSGQNNFTIIDSFGYNASSVPAGTNLTVQFSQDNSTWYNSSGDSGGWDNLSQGSDSISLSSSLGWTGGNFSYKMRFESNGSDTPVLGGINVSFKFGGNFSVASVNQAPTLINAAANATSLNVGDSINFTVFWNDSGDDVQLLIANQSDFANCNTSNQSWCLCNTSFITGGDAGNYSNCTYTAQSGDGGKTINWYAQVCDDGSLCDSLGTITDTFTDETKIASRDNLTVNTTAGQVKLNETVEGWCYQEHANVSTACGGLDTGSYACSGNWDATAPCANTSDGDWDGYGKSQDDGDSYLYINYTKPSGAENTSKWQVKDHEATTNLTIPSTCWDQSPLQLRAHSHHELAGGARSKWHCWNGTDWKELQATSAAPNYIYEEAMWWNISSIYKSSGELRSTNLLSGQNNFTIIDSFGYNASSVPAGTNLTVQFSQDNSTWYNSSGDSGGWDNLSQGSKNISLSSSLGWTGGNFSYKMRFESNGSDTPVLGEINVSFKFGGNFSVASVNQAPTLINAAANATSLNVGDSINFTVFWNDSGDDVQLLIANQSDFANCNTSNQSWCLCNTSFITGGDAGNYSNCTYTAQSGDGGKTINWYAQVCDDGDLCDKNYTKTYDFTDTTNNKAYEHLGLSTSPTDYDAEATSGNYTNLSASDNNRWITNLTTADGEYDTQIYTFNLTENGSSLLDLNVSWEGYGDNNSNYYTNLSIWNWTAGSWYQLDQKDFTSNADDTLNKSLTSGITDFINSTTQQVAVMVTTRKYVAEAYWSYQEDANATACDGTWDASYPCSNTYDSNWSTYGGASTLQTTYVYFNYTKPTNALSSSKWQVKDRVGTVNLSIDSNCWNQNPLQFKAKSYAPSDPQDMYTKWYCYNASSWVELRDSGTGIGNREIYEEAMWWNISSSSPFLYTYQDGEYTKLSDFIPGATTPEKEYTSFTDVTGTEIVDGKVRLKITEELDETTYLDRIYLRVDDNEIVELSSITNASINLLQNSDNNYLVMNQGAEHYLEFPAPAQYEKLEFAAEGYYIEHYRNSETGTHNSLYTDYVKLTVGANAEGSFSVASVNQAPTVSNVLLHDANGGSIQLSVNDDKIVYCNGTITDTNGWEDVATNGGANATFYFSENGTKPDDSDDKNHHYTNTSCTFSPGSLYDVNVSCTVTLEHEALNGTWSCNITAWDQAGLTGSNNDSEQVDQLVALNIAETQIAFGSLAVETNSSAGNSTNVTNEGNVQMDIQVSGNADMSCSVLGFIGIGNISYNYTDSKYDIMSSKKLTTGAVTETAFNLGIEGVATAEDVVSNKTEWWTIYIPTGVGGSCNNTITITAIIS